MKIEGKSSCKEYAKQVFNNIKNKIDLHGKRNKINLVIIEIYSCNRNKESEKYVKSKITKLESIGINCIHKQYNTMIYNTNEIIKDIKTFNRLRYIHGIIVQMPLPDNIKKDERKIIDAVAPSKDVDGLTSTNIGKLVAKDITGFKPCTPGGILNYIQFALDYPIKGKKVAIIGRSIIVGKPMSVLFTNCNATVTLMHSETNEEYIKQICKKSDIIIVAVGITGFFDNSFLDMSKKLPLIFDVGINIHNNKIYGDVKHEVHNFADVTPVPNGVGQLTVAMLARNLWIAAKRRWGIYE